MSNILLRNLALLLFLSIGFSAFAQEKTSPRVRAKEPTVVTVEGKQDQVSEDRKRAEAREAQKDQNIFSRAMHGLTRGVSAIGSGIGRLIGGDENVIPSEADRRSSTGEGKKQ